MKHAAAVAERTVNSRLAAGTATTSSAFELEPANYSIPDPAAVAPSGSSSTQAIHSVATLPGCAARISLDLQEAALKPQPKQAPEKALLGNSPSSRRTLPPINAAATATDPGRYTPTLLSPNGSNRRLQQQNLQSLYHLHHQTASDQHQGSSQRERGQQGSASAQKNSRPSVDAAAGAQVLGTVPASELPQQRADTDSAGVIRPFAFRGRSRSATDPPLPSATPPAPAFDAGAPVKRASAPGAPAQRDDDWSFGESLQHARTIARYAAIDAARDLHYEAPGGGRHSDSDDDVDCGKSRKARGAWKVIATLLGSSKVQKVGGAATARQGSGTGKGQGKDQMQAQARLQARAAVARRSSLAMGEGGAYVDEGGLAPVVRSRDSCRLLRVQRGRVGIDRDGQKPSKPLMPAAASVARAMAMTSEDDCSDPVTAAVVAAAAAFAAAKADQEK